MDFVLNVFGALLQFLASVHLEILIPEYGILESHIKGLGNGNSGHRAPGSGVKIWEMLFEKIVFSFL